MTKVLIVDDNEANLYLLRAVLTGYGCEVTEARHGAAAMVKARVAPPDLIVSDLLMPVMDGYTLLRQWKQDDQLKNIPFIVYTATYTEAADEKLALSMGADAFLVKPAEPEVFMARMRAVLAMARKGGLSPANEPTGDEEARLKNYNEVLIHKLEKKAIELEQANVEIAGREARLRTILDTEPECVKLLAADGSLLEMNPAGLAMIEADKFSQVANQCVFPLVTEEYRERFRELTAAAFAGESGRLEFEIIGLKGAHRWLETHATPLRDAAGNVTAFLGITRDITRSRETMLELKRSEGRFRRIMESDLMGMIFWNEAGEIAEANDSFLRTVGYSRADLEAGKVNWRNMTPPEYQAHDETAVLEVATTGSCVPFEKEYFRKDGSRVPILIGAASLPERPGHGVAFVIDISKRKAAQAALVESENRFRRFFEHSPLGVAEGEIATAKFISVNDRYADLLGYSRAELQELTFKDLTYPEDLEKDLELFAQLAAGKILTYQIEKRYVRKGGAIIWASLAVTALPHPSGEPTRCLAVLADITQRKQAEESILAHLDELKRWHAATLGREDRVLALKREVNELLVRLGQVPRYASAESPPGSKP